MASIKSLCSLKNYSDYEQGDCEDQGKHLWFDPIKAEGKIDSSEPLLKLEGEVDQELSGE